MKRMTPERLKYLRAAVVPGWAHASPEVEEALDEIEACWVERDKWKERAAVYAADTQLQEEKNERLRAAMREALDGVNRKEPPFPRDILREALKE